MLSHLSEAPASTWEIEIGSGVTEIFTIILYSVHTPVWNTSDFLNSEQETHDLFFLHVHMPIFF